MYYTTHTHYQVEIHVIFLSAGSNSTYKSQKLFDAVNAEKKKMRLKLKLRCGVAAPILQIKNKLDKRRRQWQRWQWFILLSLQLLCVSFAIDSHRQIGICWHYDYLMNSIILYFSDLFWWSNEDFAFWPFDHRPCWNAYVWSLCLVMQTLESESISNSYGWESEAFKCARANLLLFSTAPRRCTSQWNRYIIILLLLFAM